MSLTVSHLDVSHRSPSAAMPRVHAVRGVSFQLPEGDIGVLLGHSGSGKTTLLRAIAGLDEVSRGAVHVGGQPVVTDKVALPAAQRQVGMVFQDLALFPHLDVFDNVAFGLSSWAREAREARVQALLAMMSLDTLARRRPHQLSGGQQQRVALARALAPEPKLLLLDEPFASLDRGLRTRLAQDVRAMLKRTGSTALFVTHDQEEAFALADHVGLMHEGRLHQWATPADLYHRPATREVATFVGEGSWLRATLQHAAGRAVLAHPACGECVLPDEPRQDPLTSGPCDWWVRPEDVHPDDGSQLRGQVTHQLFQGGSTLYSMTLPNGEQVQMRLTGRLDVAVGQTLGVRISPRHHVIFPSP